MPAPRTADDKFLALLARMPAPLDTTEIAELLGWSCDNTLLVGNRLAREGLVVRIEGERNGEAGRPPLQFALPGALPAPGSARPAPLAPDTYVVTPTNEEARVVGMCGRSHAELEYITGAERFQRAVLHIALLRPFQPGRDRPEPVRIESAKAAA